MPAETIVDNKSNNPLKVIIGMEELDQLLPWSDSIPKNCKVPNKEDNIKWAKSLKGVVYLTLT